MPLTNPVLARWVSSWPVAAGPGGDGQRAAERVFHRGHDRVREVLAGQGGGHLVLVAGVEQAADDRDAERAAELDGRGAGRGRHAAVARRAPSR